jgi:hypothetical protein
MERAIVDELCGLVEAVLARRLRELASRLQSIWSRTRSPP